MVSEAQKKATKKYQQTAYDNISLRIPKGERDIIRSFAEAENLSLSQYIRIACFERAGQTPPPMMTKE